MQVFCSKCGTMQEKVARKDSNQEIVFECVKKHFIKFPAGGDIAKLVEEHNKVNFRPVA